MKRIGFLIALTALVLVAGQRAYAEAIKVAFVEAQKVLELSQSGKQVQAKMEEFVMSRQKIIDIEEKDLRDREEELTRQAALLSPEAKKMKQEEFQKKLMDYQKRARDLNKEVQDKKIESLKLFNSKMEEVVKAIAEKEGYSFVLDKGNEGSVVLFAKESFDITDLVVKELDRQEAPKAAPKAAAPK